jgi:polysaccharide biosynthesis protein PslG
VRPHRRLRRIGTPAIGTGFVVSLLAALSLAVTGAVGAPPAGRSASPRSNAQTTFNVQADAYVRSDRPTSNYGTSSSLSVDGSPQKRSYLLFSVQGVSGSVQQATLSLDVKSGSGISVSLASVPSTSWGEQTITWSNAPALGATLSSFSTPASDTRVSVDVTQAVTGNGLVSFALTTSSSTSTRFYSREAGSSYTPTLTVQTADSASAPANTVAPTISGSAQVGQTMTATTGTWSGTAPISYAYQWQRCNSAGASCTSISGATSPSYTLTSDDNGSTVLIQVTASNSAGSASAVSAASAVVQAAAAGAAPVNSSPPTIAGTTQVGQTLSATTGSWTNSPTSYAYQWQECNTYNGAVLSDAPNAYLRLSETSGTSAADASGHGNGGTYTGTYSLNQAGPVSSSCDADRAAALTGTAGSYVLVPDSSSLDVGDTFTLEAWVRLNATTDADLINKDANGYVLRIVGSRLALRKSQVADIVQSTTTLSADGKYHQLVATKSGSSVHLYIDGVDVTGTVTNQTIANTTSALHIGSSYSGANVLNGNIAEVAIYPTALSAARLLAHYNDRSAAFASISAASSSSYTLVQGDSGSTMRANVTASNSMGSASAPSDPSAQVQAASAPAPPPPPPPPPAPSGSGDYFGFSWGSMYLQNESDATLTQDLNTMQAAGAHWLRMNINWSVIQQAGPTSYNWAPFDRVVQAARARGFNVLGEIAYTPPWALPAGVTDSHHPPANVSDYANFASAAATHFSAMGVHAYEVWNEPNVSVFWQPAPDPAAYVSLLKAAYPAIHSADPQATVVTGGMAPSGGSNGIDLPPVTFLTSIYADGAKGYFDAVGHHPYCWPALPGDAQGWSAWYQMYGTSPSLRSVMEANGDGDKKIWGTEFGAPTNGPAGSYVDEATQALMITTAYQLWTTYSWAGPLFTYTSRDYGTSTSTRENFFGLLHNDFTAKPSYAAYQAAAGVG